MEDRNGPTLIGSTQQFIRIEAVLAEVQKELQELKARAKPARRRGDDFRHLRGGTFIVSAVLGNSMAAEGVDWVEEDSP